jgi:hypothetical protein
MRSQIYFIFNELNLAMVTTSSRISPSIMTTMMTIRSTSPMVTNGSQINGLNVRINLSF